MKGLLIVAGLAGALVGGWFARGAYERWRIERVIEDAVLDVDIVTGPSIADTPTSRLMVMCDPELKIGDHAYLAIPDHVGDDGMRNNADHLKGYDGYSQHEYGILAEVVTCEPWTSPRTVSPPSPQCPRDFMPGFEHQ